MNPNFSNTFSTGSFKTCPSYDNVPTYSWTLPNIPDSELPYLTSARTPAPQDHGFVFTNTNTFTNNVAPDLTTHEGHGLIMPARPDATRSDSTGSSAQDFLCVNYFAQFNFQPVDQSCSNQAMNKGHQSKGISCFETDSFADDGTKEHSAASHPAAGVAQPQFTSPSDLCDNEGIVSRINSTS